LINDRLPKFKGLTGFDSRNRGNAKGFIKPLNGNAYKQPELKAAA